VVRWSGAVGREAAAIGSGAASRSSDGSSLSAAPLASPVVPTPPP